MHMPFFNPVAKSLLLQPVLKGCPAALLLIEARSVSERFHVMAVFWCFWLRAEG